MGTRTIGQLASAAGVNVETIRYYERRGLLRQPPRIGDGYRRYSEDDLDRLHFVARAKRLGFTLSEIGALIGPATDGSTGSILELARSKMDDLRRQQDALAATQQRLTSLIDVCADPNNEDCAALRVTT
jgi:MerR family transcriptional regulator, mercuric resistance operon regulatory protein